MTISDVVLAALVTGIVGLAAVFFQRLLPDRTQVQAAEVTATAVERKSILELGQQLRAELRADLERSEKELDDALSELKQAREDLKEAQARLEQARAENVQLKAENLQLKSRVTTLEQENCQLKERVAALEQKG